MQKSTPLISVAMATYNGEKYIAKQLESILAQTYGPIEIVITDDASTDNTVQLIEKFQKDHGCIKLLKNEHNRGVNKTFENSFLNCSGDFIAISDQDDIWELHKIETLLKELGDEDAIYSNSLLVDTKGNSLNKEFKSLMKLQSYFDGAPFLMGNCVPGHTILMKTVFARIVLPLPEDMMFDRWISFCAASNNGLKYVDSPLVRYRQHENNLVGTGKTKNRKKRKTNKEKYYLKLADLKTFQQAPILNESTRQILDTMTRLFTRKLSLHRGLFFLKNMEQLLVIKNKPKFRKVLYCFKMVFKPNY